MFFSCSALSIRLRAVVSRIALDTYASPRIFDRAQANLNGKLRAVLAQPVEIQPCAHRANARRLLVVLAVRRMQTAKPLRHENFNVLTEQFRPNVAEELFGLGIDEHDLAAMIRDDHRIRR